MERTDLKNRYGEVSQRLNKIGFGLLWTNFKRYKFALYDSKEICFDGKILPYDPKFLGNTSIFYKNEYVAIWNLEMDSVPDADFLAANIVHEMFHCFQRENGETRYPDDLELLTYPQNPENYNAKFFENVYLCGAFSEKDKETKIGLFDLFAGVRNFRKTLIGKDIINEFRAETVEGLAEYVGTLALRRLSPDKYRVRMGEYINFLRDEKLIFDIRRVSYFTGVMYFSLLEDIRPDFKRFKPNETKTLYELTESEKPSLPTAIEVNQNLQKRYGEIIGERKSKIDTFKAKRRTELPVGCRIEGYDPMNMFRLGDFIFCSHFVFLSGPLAIEKPVLLEMKSGSAAEVAAYFTE